MTRLAVPSKEVQLRIVGPANSFFASRVQRLTINNDVPTTNIDELGNPQHAGVVTDVPNISLTFSAFDVGIRIFSILTGTSFTSYPAGGVDIGDLGEIDAILYVKDAAVSDYVKSAHARRLQVQNFTFNYSVDGESTEEYTAIGSKRRYFKNDVVVDRFVTGSTSFTLSQTPIQLKNGDKLISVILDGQYKDEVSGGPTAGEYSVSGTALTTGDTRTAQVLAIYHASPAGSNWSDISDAIQAVAIRGRDVKIVIGTSNIERVQSVTINGNLNTTPVREMGSRDVIGYQKQVPDVTGNITVLDTDTELIGLLATGNPAPADTEFSFEGGCEVVNLSLEVKLYDPCDTTISGVVLKTVYIPTLRIVGDSYTSNVNDNASVTFNFQSEDSQCIIYSGPRP